MVRYPLSYTLATIRLRNSARIAFAHACSLTDRLFSCFQFQLFTAFDSEPSIVPPSISEIVRRVEVVNMSNSDSFRDTIMY